MNRIILPIKHFLLFHVDREIINQYNMIIKNWSDLMSLETVQTYRMFFCQTHLKNWMSQVSNFWFFIVLKTVLQINMSKIIMITMGTAR